LGNFSQSVYNTIALTNQWYFGVTDACLSRRQGSILVDELDDVVGVDFAAGQAVDLGGVDAVIVVVFGVGIQHRLDFCCGSVARFVVDVVVFIVVVVIVVVFIVIIVVVVIVVVVIIVVVLS